LDGVTSYNALYNVLFQTLDGSIVKVLCQHQTDDHGFGELKMKGSSQWEYL